MGDIKYGYRWFNGIILNNYHTDLYNKISSEIESVEKSEPLKVEWIESLKQKRHIFLSNCFLVYGGGSDK